MLQRTSPLFLYLDNLSLLKEEKGFHIWTMFDKVNEKESFYIGFLPRGAKRAQRAQSCFDLFPSMF